MAAEHVQWYSTKVDRWLVPVLAVPPVAVIAVCVAFVAAGSHVGLMAGVAMAVLVAGVYAGLVFPMRYGVGDGELVVRFGVCRQRISLPEITAVTPTSSPLGAPALSLDRLRVQYGPGAFKGVTISPADRGEFLDVLARRAGLKREGEGLVRG